MRAIAFLFMATTALAARAPLISQRFPAGRPRGYRGESRCGPTTVAMVARGFHRRADLSDAALIEMLDRTDDGLENHATAPEGVLRMLAALRLHARVLPGFDVGWLRDALAHGAQVIALGRPRFLPPSQAHTGGHYVSIVGVTARGAFIVNDPYRRSGTRAARYRVSPKTLAAFIRHKPNGRLFAVFPDAPRVARTHVVRARR